MKTSDKPKLSQLSSKYSLKPLPDRFNLYPSLLHHSPDPCKNLNLASPDVSRLSLESKSLRQQRRAIRDLLNFSSVRSSTNFNKSSLQVIGKSESFERLKYNFSPVTSYTSREILNPITKSKTSVFEARGSEMAWKRDSLREGGSEEDEKGKRKTVILDRNHLDISETEEPDESIQFKARYN